MGHFHLKLESTNLRTLVVTFMGLLAFAGISQSQISATGCGILSETDALKAPAAGIEQGVVAYLEPLPYGIAGLTYGMLLLAVPSWGGTIWVSGRTVQQWADVSIGGRKQIFVGKNFAFGLAPRLRYQQARGFQAVVDVLVDVNAQTDLHGWTLGVSLNAVDIVGNQARPTIQCGAKKEVDTHALSVDVGISGQGSLALILVDHWRITPLIQMCTALSTAPLSCSITGRLAYSNDLDFIAGLTFVNALGATPRLAIRWVP